MRESSLAVEALVLQGLNIRSVLEPWHKPKLQEEGDSANYKM